MTTDFRVLQTYGEIRQLIEDTAYTQLADDSFSQVWVATTAKQIADGVVGCLDAAEGLYACPTCGENVTRYGRRCPRCERNMEEDRLERESGR